MTPENSTGSVVLDIGHDMGSLVVYVPMGMLGSEVEISPCGPDARRTHVGVWERRVNGRRVAAAAFPPLPAGDYDVWGPDTGSRSTVAIAPGRVTELHCAGALGPS